MPCLALCLSFGGLASGPWWSCLSAGVFRVLPANFCRSGRLGRFLQFLPLGAPRAVPAASAAVSRFPSLRGGSHSLAGVVTLLPFRRVGSHSVAGVVALFSCWRGGSVHVAARGASGGFGASAARGASGGSGVFCRPGHPEWFLRFLRFLPLVWLFRLATASEASCDDQPK